METGSVGLDTSAAADPRVQSSLACLRRRAWAQSRDSIWQESEAESCDSQGPRENQRDGEQQRPSEEPGRVPNKITSWLIECRTPIGASLDDQTASSSKAVLKNGCSFEDDLSLGAEANHLQSSKNQTESCFGLAADQKRSQYKERTRSMNSTGSGKSSTVSSVSELLDLYEEDPEEILLNLGFGREEPDLASKVPSRFFNNSSIARGIDVKVYLGAQLQRMEVENPNYALTSRFRQIEVLTTVANEFFQLYSQVSGQPVQRISSRDQDGAEGAAEEASPSLRRTGSARNVAKLLKKTISKHNMYAAAAESPDAHTPPQHAQPNAHAASDHTHTNGLAHAAAPEPDACGADADHQAETANQKHTRKKDGRSLATVTEETNGDGEDSPDESRTAPAADGEHQAQSADSQSTNQRTEEASQVVKEEEEQKNLTSTPDKAPPTLATPLLAQLRTENADSFDMEEISNEDEALPHRTSKTTSLLRTVSQQSDSSGFAEEPSADSNSYLKVQESSDSCDSETTVTSHPSLDVATPLARDQPAFELPGPDREEEEEEEDEDEDEDEEDEDEEDEDEEEDEAGPDAAAAAEDDGKSSSRGKEDEHDGSSEQVLQYTAHHLPKSGAAGLQLDETRDQEEDPEPQPEPEEEIAQSMSAAEKETQPELELTQNQPAAEQAPEPELEPTQNQPAAEQAPEPELEHTQNQPAAEQEQNQTDTEPPPAEGPAQEEHTFLDVSGPHSHTAPPSPVLSALIRAKQSQLTRGCQQVALNSPRIPGRGRGRRGGVPLQRSSSLPSSLLPPCRVVSSVRIQFGKGPASCTQPRYSFKYTQDGEGNEEEETEEGGGQTSCLSTLIINPASSSDNRPAETPVPPKPIPRYLLRSTCSLQSSSPPPDWSSGGHSWSTQSVPDLSSNQPQPGQFQQNMSASDQNRQSWSPGQMMFRYPAAQCVNPSSTPSPSLYSSPCPLTPQYPSSLHPYASLPNLHQHTFTHHSSLNSLYHPPHHAAVHPGPAATHHQHHQGYNHLYAHHPSPYHAPQFASPYLGYHGYNMSPHLPFLPQHPGVAQCPPLEHGLHPGFAHPPPPPGFFPGLGHGLHPGLAPHAAAPGSGPGPGPGHGPSNTEMQLRRVLHDIRGTVQGLNQNRTNTPDTFSERRSAPSSSQSLAEFQQKRRSLNLFRSQMMDLELSIVRQQALVYKHLSPADRMEVEQLQSLRSAVREELQELEQQLEGRLMELTHLTQHRGLHGDGSVDSLSTASALRAMEPVSDLLREQLFLQSELSYDGHAPSTDASSRSSSPVRGGGDGERGGGVYRATININPAPPPRPNAHSEEEEGEEEERDGGRAGGGGGGVSRVSEEEGAAGGLTVGSLQQLIREIRESVAQEVRQEIYNELLAAVSPRRSPLPGQQHPL